MEEAQRKLKNELDIEFENNMTNEYIIEIYTKVTNSVVCSLKDLAKATDNDCDRLRAKIFHLKKEGKRLRGRAKKVFLESNLNCHAIQVQ
jgi:hypothetical protein